MELIYSLLAILNEMSPYVLLGFFIAGLLHVFVKPAVMAKHLSGNGLKPVLKSALFGIPLPLCSCGVLPTAVSLRRAGASNAAATSFLIATPQTGVDSIAATWSLLGPAMAVVRPVAALVCSVFGGVAVGRFAPSVAEHESQTHHDGHESPAHNHDCTDSECHGAHCCEIDFEASCDTQVTFIDKLKAAMRYGFVDMIQHVGKWLVIGLVVAALITVFVPDDLFVSLARYPLLAMVAMVAVAVPMYICATGSIPIAMSLMLKGLTPGVAFVMLMAGPAANFASVMVLRKSIGTRATMIYIVSVVVTAIAFGLLIDYVLPTQWFALTGKTALCCHEAHAFGWLDTLCSAVLVCLLAYAFYLTKLKEKQQIPTEMDKRTYKIQGMMCPHCQANVQKGLESLDGVTAVTVNLSEASADVAGVAEPETVIAMIRSLGYEAELAD